MDSFKYIIIRFILIRFTQFGLFWNSLEYKYIYTLYLTEVSTPLTFL